MLVSIGTPNSEEVLRSGLAMGADRGLASGDRRRFAAPGVARALKAVVEKETPELMILGKQAIEVGLAADLFEVLPAFSKTLDNVV